MSGALGRGRSPARIEVRGFGFRHLARPDWAVRDISFVIEPGERVLLLGASGAGKSTLLSAIAGLLDYESGDIEGEILIDGEPPRAGDGRAGIVFQDPDAQIVMGKCGDDVAFGLENHGVPRIDIWSRVHDALAEVDFGYDVDRSTHSLSGGERQRLVLAGVLALQPGLLLLDEPTANLDPEGTATIVGALDRLCRNRSSTILMIEHKVSLALPLVDRVIVISRDDGVVADGTPSTVMRDRGASLAAQGVWLDDTPPVPPRPTAAIGDELLLARGARYRHAAGGPLLPQPVDLTLRAGTTTALVGPNGSGKSTLAMMLSGLRGPTTGTVAATGALADAAVRRKPIHKWKASTLASRISTVFQNPEHQFLTGTLAAEIALGARQTGRRDAQRRADELLERLHLTHLADANPFTLSGGEKRRLSVATALATRPAVLILDEPTFGQDRRTWAELHDLLVQQRDAGAALLVVTHDNLLVDSLADDVVGLQRTEQVSG